MQRAIFKKIIKNHSEYKKNHSEYKKIDMSNAKNLISAEHDGKKSLPELVKLLNFQLETCNRKPG